MKYKCGLVGLVVCLDKVLIILNVYEYRRLLGYGPNQNGMTQFTQFIYSYSVTEKTNRLFIIVGEWFVRSWEFHLRRD